MKKLISIILSLISVICISFAFSGCGLPTTELFTVGTYETFEIEGEPFTKAKFIIQAISEEGFESANGINVIKNESKDKKNKIYYSFELFLYDDTKCEYIQAEIYNLAHKQGHHVNDYDGVIENSFLNGNKRGVFTLSYGDKSWVVVRIENGDVTYLRFTIVE